jgi:acetyltransferase
VVPQGPLGQEEPTTEAAAAAECEVETVQARLHRIGWARRRTSADGLQCEFAMVVGDAWHRQGIGERLLSRLLAVARKPGIRQVTGVTMATNASMKALARKLGFNVHPDPQDATLSLLAITL